MVIPKFSTPSLSRVSNTVILGAVTVMTATSGAVVYSSTRSYSASHCDKRRGRSAGDGGTNGDDGFRIESHLMDRIGQKQYLTTAKDQIPSTFRVLAIDIKEMRSDAFTGTCRLSQDKVFLDEIAPPKVVYVANGDTTTGESSKEDGKPVKNNLKKHGSKLTISQKALVKSIVHCSSPQSQQHVGVELLEASVSDLNPYKLRKKQRIGTWEYDPGKYYQSRDTEESQLSRHKAHDEIAETVASSEYPPSWENDPSFVESQAPWNQYAWMEELRLRINGQVRFDAPMERSRTYERVLFGHVYKTTIPQVHKVVDYFIPFSFAKSNPEGLDSRQPGNVRACNKPHAVIANGAALQLVPSSLRLLQKICKKADVPLFVVHDPRSWGGNTQASLQEALIAMRSTVKNRIISNALKQQGSLSFTRGRMLGQAETEAKWQLRDKKQRAKEMLGLDTRRKLKREDWSQYDSAMLEKKLIDRNVIQRTADDPKALTYTKAMVEVSEKCVQSNSKAVQESASGPAEADDEDDDTFSPSNREPINMKHIM